MKLVTGGNKIQFEKWYEDKFNTVNKGGYIHIVGFYNLCFEYQIGVYLAYYGSLGYYITNDWGNQLNEVVYKSSVWNNRKEHLTCDGDTRNDAYKEAFKKADELVNKNK